MKDIKEILHAKRVVTENHIKQLQQEGREGIRYTAMMPDVPFLILALVCDVGWIIHLIASTIYFFDNGFGHVLDWMALVALVGVILGVSCIIYVNKIHEKEIATKFQKNISFGLTVYAGLAGGIIGIFQIVLNTGTISELIWISAGGFINFAAGFPIYLSFKKGIVYGVH